MTICCRCKTQAVLVLGLCPACIIKCVGVLRTRIDDLRARIRKTEWERDQAEEMSAWDNSRLAIQNKLCRKQAGVIRQLRAEKAEAEVKDAAMIDYIAGYDDTVENQHGDPEERAQDIWKELEREEMPG